MLLALERIAFMLYNSYNFGLSTGIKHSNVVDCIKYIRPTNPYVREKKEKVVNDRSGFNTILLFLILLLLYCIVLWLKFRIGRERREIKADIDVPSELLYSYRARSKSQIHVTP